MSVNIDKEKCIGCGACASICPDGFELGDDGKAVIKDENTSCLDAAVSSCPVDAITKG